MKRNDVDRLVDSFYRLVRLAQEDALPTMVSDEEKLFEQYAKKLGLRRGAKHIIERDPAHTENQRRNSTRKVG